MRRFDGGTVCQEGLVREKFWSPEVVLLVQNGRLFASVKKSWSLAWCSWCFSHTYMSCTSMAGDCQETGGGGSGEDRGL